MTNAGEFVVVEVWYKAGGHAQTDRWEFPVGTYVYARVYGKGKGVVKAGYTYISYRKAYRITVRGDWRGCVGQGDSMKFCENENIGGNVEDKGVIRNAEVPH